MCEIRRTIANFSDPDDPRKRFYPDTSYIQGSLNIVSVYLAYRAGNHVLSLLGRQIAFQTAMKGSLTSGVMSFFAGFLVDGAAHILGT